MRLSGAPVIERASKGVWRGTLGRCNSETRSASMKFPSVPESTSTESTWIRPLNRKEADSKERVLGDFCRGVTLTCNPLATRESNAWGLVEPQTQDWSAFSSLSFFFLSIIIILRSCDRPAGASCLLWRMSASPPVGKSISCPSQDPNCTSMVETLSSWNDSSVDMPPVATSGNTPSTSKFECD
ncbi:hypothetical protein SKAU_G00160430 [Synaphobranchus kaupii]|uniref:Uncharacterized protein n=1 Tax=Synaphobranchus kaupii TaxID=118154 RepID=A0A9Q1FIK7_SYNKA|nr:hypothetical protein SKAU_G00160430 [Synaphobranchus kaupii]